MDEGRTWVHFVQKWCFTYRMCFYDGVGNRPDRAVPGEILVVMWWKATTDDDC